MSTAVPPAPSMRILIVDDSPIVALGLAVPLRELGYRIVETVESGEEALRSAAEHQPDVIIMDIDLAGDMDGITAAIEIRNRLGVRSIFFTGCNDPSLRERAREAAPIAFVDKGRPVSAIVEALRVASFSQPILV